MKKVFEVFLVFLGLGCTSFGGPIAHVAYFRIAFVEKRKWLSEQEFAHLFTICQTLPGPASSQLGFAIGMLRAGGLGGLAAFIAFTLPSVCLLILFAKYSYLLSSNIGLAAISGLTIVAFVVVLQAVLGMSKQLLHSHFHWFIALFVFCGVLLSNSLVWQIMFIFVAATANFLWENFIKIRVSKQSVQASSQENDSQEGISNLKLGWRSSSLAGFAFIGLWLAMPLINTYLYPHANAFYSSGAMVFGGGHVVLPYLEASTVAPDLLSKETFLAGYGATQAVPGPMFSFASYLGFELSAMQVNASQQSLAYAPILGAIMATIFVFLPGFLLLIAVLPFSNKLLKNNKLTSAFAGANAAVVGLLAATLYDPIFVHAVESKQSLIIAAIAFLAINRFKLPIIAMIIFCVLASIVLGM